MQKIEKLVNKILAIEVISAVVFGPIARAVGIEDGFYDLFFQLSTFLILFEGGLDILFSALRLVKYISKRQKEDFSGAVEAFISGAFRLWIFAVLLYTMNYIVSLNCI